MGCVTFTGCGTNEYVPAPPHAVDVAQPVADSITRTLEFTGTTEAFEKVDIQARVKGFLNEIKFRPGSDVQAGDMLYVIDQQPFKVRVAEAEAAVAMAEAQKQSA